MMLNQITAKQNQQQVETLREEVSTKQRRIVELSRRVETLEESLKAARSKRGVAAVSVPLEDAISFASVPAEGSKVVGVKIPPDLRSKIDAFKEAHNVSSARHAVIALLHIATATLTTTDT